MGHADSPERPSWSPELERVIVSTGRVRKTDPARDGVQDATRPDVRIEERELEAGGLN
jgi:hypothetical protein